jgi:hypothetical protein
MELSMRLLPVTLALAFVLGFSTLAHADGITFITSLYTDAGEITLTSHLPSAGLAEAMANGFYYGPGDFYFDSSVGLTTVITDFLGSTVDNRLAVDALRGQPFAILDPVGNEGLISGISDAEMTHSTGPVVGPGSLYTDYEFCTAVDRNPDRCSLNVDGLILDNYVPGSGFSEIIVDGSTPEPSTFALLGTGVLAMAGAVRRRLVSA